MIRDCGAEMTAKVVRNWLEKLGVTIMRLADFFMPGKSRMNEEFIVLVFTDDHETVIHRRTHGFMKS